MERARTLTHRAAWLAALVGLLLATAPACSQGEGEGRIAGTLDVPGCWAGPFALAPDFFGAVPYRDGLHLRIQNGSDFQTFSDGVSILLHDTSKLRPDPASDVPGRYGEALPVDLPPEVTPPGVPVLPGETPALVSLTLYLQRSCRTENVTLHAVREVALGGDGACDAPAVMGANPSAGCAPDVESPAGAGSGQSLIAFTSIANGKLDEAIASERLNAGCFDVYLADPREAEGGGVGPPPPCRGHIKGTFSFFFERGRPAQPFP